MTSKETYLANIDATLTLLISVRQKLEEDLPLTVEDQTVLLFFNELDEDMWT